jgi:aspartate/methionine/tyrosine aminotransferase
MAAAPANALSQALATARAQAARGGRPVLDLTQSNPTEAGIPYAEEAILRALARPDALRYEPHAFGLPAARGAVARHLSEASGGGGPPVDPGHVVLTASTSEAYAFVFKLLADPGDEILVPRPSYPLLDHLAQLESVRCVPYRLAYDGAWHLDAASVRAAVSPRTRAIVVVQPNNPTGSPLTRAELEVLASVGVPIVSDEVFARFALREDAPPVVSALAVSAPLVFALGGLSKTAALPQVKLGWIAVAGERARVAEALEALEVIADTFLSVGTPVQLAAADLLATRATAARAIATRTRRNLAQIARAVAGTAISLLDAQAGWYAVLRLPATETEEAWTVGFVERDAVYVHPGHFFDFEEEAYVAVSLLTPEATLAEGVRRIVERVASRAA